MIGIEIFSGVGGMSLGATMAGIEIVMAIEIDKDAASTFKLNHPHTDVIVSDIKDIKSINVKVAENQQNPPLHALFPGGNARIFSISSASR